ncbi:INDH1 [Auxenochlorella protothecoides x Auxenochlorella symbiontica]
MSGRRGLWRAFSAMPRRGPPPPPPKFVLPGIKHIVAVASGKGGVGKSTTAVNLAVAMSQSLGLRVGLLDADVFGPSVGHMLGLSGKPEIGEGGLMVPRSAHGVRCMSMAFLLAQDAPAIWRGPMVMGALETLMSKVLWAPLDVLLLDLPPGTGDAQLTVTQRLHLSGAVIVSTPQDIALLDARRGALMFRQVGVPVLGIVENMSYFVCGHCGGESHIFGQGGVQKAAADLHMPLLGQVPLNIDIREGADGGDPVVSSAPSSASARAYVSVAEAILRQIEERSGSAVRPKDS